MAIYRITNGMGTLVLFEMEETDSNVALANEMKTALDETNSRWTFFNFENLMARFEVKVKYVDPIDIGGVN